MLSRRCRRTDALELLADLGRGGLGGWVIYSFEGKFGCGEGDGSECNGE